MGYYTKSYYTISEGTLTEVTEQDWESREERQDPVVIETQVGQALVTTKFESVSLGSVVPHFMICLQRPEGMTEFPWEQDGNALAPQFCLSSIRDACIAHNTVVWMLEREYGVPSQTRYAPRFLPESVPREVRPDEEDDNADDIFPRS